MRVKALVTAVGVGITLVAFQNCGKLGFKLGSDGKSSALSALATGQAGAPTLTVSGAVATLKGEDADLTVLTANTDGVTYSCVNDADKSLVLPEGVLTLADGVGVLAVPIEQNVTCTFTAISGAQLTESVVSIPVLNPI